MSKKDFNSQLFLTELRRYNQTIGQLNAHQSSPSKYSSYHPCRGFHRLSKVHFHSSIIPNEMIDDLSLNLLDDHLALVRHHWWIYQMRLTKKIGSLQNDLQRHLDVSLKKKQCQCQSRLFQWLTKHRNEKFK